jgi:hypothetical protein
MDPFVYMLDREAVSLIVNQVFLSIDSQDYQSMAPCFDREVVFDITSLVGGDAVRVNVTQISNVFDRALKGLDHCHHQISNMTIFVQNDRATTFFYCTETHHKKTMAGSQTRSLTGTYDVHLVKFNGIWKITFFKYNHKFMIGNLDLK